MPINNSLLFPSTHSNSRLLHNNQLPLNHPLFRLYLNILDSLPERDNGSLFSTARRGSHARVVDIYYWKHVRCHVQRKKFTCPSSLVRSFRSVCRVYWRYVDRKLQIQFDTQRNPQRYPSQSKHYIWQRQAGLNPIETWVNHHHLPIVSGTHFSSSANMNFRSLRSRKTIPWSWHAFTVSHICRKRRFASASRNRLRILTYECKSPCKLRRMKPFLLVAIDLWCSTEWTHLGRLEE